MKETEIISDEISIPQLRKLLKPHLSDHFFERSPDRVSYLAIAYSVLAAHIWATAKFLPGELPWITYLISLIAAINVSAFYFFFFHELLHGAIVRRGWLMTFLGFMSGAPTLCAPTVWSRWHNLHHAKTAGIDDPDRARHPEYDDYSKLKTRIHERLKRFHVSDILSFIVPFGVIIGHHFIMYSEMILSPKSSVRLRWRLSLEYLLVIALFLAPLLFLKTSTALLGVYLPLLLGQMICNLYILSNHNSRLLTRKNLPLLNSLSVCFHRKLPISHMDFGRHVEHHIFPEVAHSRLKELTPILRRDFPESYAEVSLSEALIAIYTRKSHKQEII